MVAQKTGSNWFMRWFQNFPCRFKKKEGIQRDSFFYFYLFPKAKWAFYSKLWQLQFIHQMDKLRFKRWILSCQTLNIFLKKATLWCEASCKRLILSAHHSATDKCHLSYVGHRIKFFLENSEFCDRFWEYDTCRSQNWKRGKHFGDERTPKQIG